MTVPQSVNVIDAGDAAGDGQRLIWPFNLAEPDQLTLDAWLKLPAQPVLISALIQSGATPDWIDQNTVSLDITPEALATVDAVHVQAVAITDKAYKQVQKYLKRSLLCIDELGYLPLDKTGADLLFQIISHRYEKGSIILTANRAFKHWPEIFNNDSTITSAVLDRLLHHAETVVIEGQSYRMKDRIEP